MLLYKLNIKSEENDKSFIKFQIKHIHLVLESSYCEHYFVSLFKHVLFSLNGSVKSFCYNIDICFMYICSSGCVRKSPCDVLPPFPNIFHKSIDSNGFISPVLRHPKQGKAKSNKLTHY